MCWCVVCYLKTACINKTVSAHVSGVSEFTMCIKHIGVALILCLSESCKVQWISSKAPGACTLGAAKAKTDYHSTAPRIYIGVSPACDEWKPWEQHGRKCCRWIRIKEPLKTRPCSIYYSNMEINPIAWNDGMLCGNSLCCIMQYNCTQIGRNNMLYGT